MENVKYLYAKNKKTYYWDRYKVISETENSYFIELNDVTKIDKKLMEHNNIKYVDTDGMDKVYEEDQRNRREIREVVERFENIFERLGLFDN